MIRLYDFIGSFGNEIMALLPLKLIDLSRKRVSATGLLRLLALSAFPGALFASIWRVGFILAGVPFVAAVWPIFIFLPPLFVIIYHIARPLPLSFAVNIADRSLALKDRLNTWYELRDSSHPWFPAIEKNLIDAIQRRPQPERAIRIRLPYETRLLPLPAAVVAVAVFFPWEQIATGNSKEKSVFILDETADAVQPGGSAVFSTNANATGVIRMARLDLSRGAAMAPTLKSENEPSRTPAAVIVRRATGTSAGQDAGAAPLINSRQTTGEPDVHNSTGTGGSTDESNASKESAGLEQIATDRSTPRARLDKAFVDQATRFPEVAVALVQFRKSLE